MRGTSPSANPGRRWHRPRATGRTRGASTVEAAMAHLGPRIHRLPGLEILRGRHTRSSARVAAGSGRGGITARHCRATRAPQRRASLPGRPPGQGRASRPRRSPAGQEACGCHGHERRELQRSLRRNSTAPWPADALGAPPRLWQAGLTGHPRSWGLLCPAPRLFIGQREEASGCQDLPRLNRPPIGSCGSCRRSRFARMVRSQ